MLPSILVMQREARSTCADLQTGTGRVSAESGVLAEAEVTWKKRTEREEGTSPEELLAAAHSSCFSMQLSAFLAKEGTPAEELKTTATVSFVVGQGITKILLEVSGRVPGSDQAKFVELAEQAKKECPVSKALASVPSMEVRAKLPAARGTWPMAYVPCLWHRSSHAVRRASTSGSECLELALVVSLGKRAPMRSSSHSRPVAAAPPR